MLLVGTKGHLTDLDRSYAYVDDASVDAIAVGPATDATADTGEPADTAGPAQSGRRPVRALLDGQRIVGLEETQVAPLARLPTPSAQSMAATAGGALLVGLEGGHLSTMSADGLLHPVPSFDALDGRDRWSNPAASSPDLRSIAVSENDRWFAAVHLGGVWRSDDQGRSWRNVVPAEADGHEVVTSGVDRVAVAAAKGFGWSTDGGDSWQWSTDGLHAPYCRAVALDGDSAFLTASTGPWTTDGRLYRARLGKPFEPCGDTLPRSFPCNLDTGSVATAGDQVAVGTNDGRVFRSGDRGSTWDLVLHSIWPVNVVRFT